MVISNNKDSTQAVDSANRQTTSLDLALTPRVVHSLVRVVLSMTSSIQEISNKCNLAGKREDTVQGVPQGKLVGPMVFLGRTVWARVNRP